MMKRLVLLLPHAGPAWPVPLGRSATATPVLLGGARPDPEGSWTEGAWDPEAGPWPGVGRGEMEDGKEEQEAMAAARLGPC